jgi:hypothetical protein
MPGMLGSGGVLAMRIDHQRIVRRVADNSGCSNFVLWRTGFTEPDSRTMRNHV